ncbi:DUF4439 domain-containing protein [Actinomadura namibiensis]|uniref:DUF4439 domain-containing protein n=1 Tax=Actinomadura namibiensis TaxID=182080 RepID=A0A7W3LK26_ACTNM|nr:DUF4439 domain-containing protein [Actinomadura namibiensis]MBA8949579.1 hypothetical protein [Actinomadura namibiensis]
MTDVPALQEALKAEHAAVYGYGVLGARLRGTHQATARVMWNLHRARRDALAERLTAAGATPEAAAPVYRLPVRPTSGRTAGELAAALEDAVVAALVGAAGAADAGLRSWAARAMQESAGNAAHWRTAIGRPPGAGAFPGLPAAALAPRPRPGA